MTSKFKINIRRSVSKATKELNLIAKEMSKKGTVKVGLPSGSNNYPDGTSVIMVGAVQEFGSPARKVPERSFLRSTLFEKRRVYKKLFAELGFKVLMGKLTSDEAMRILGLTVESDVKEKITDISSPPLKIRKGNPLVDTGHLRRSITHEVS